MADGRITVEVSTQAAHAELERLRDQNATLKRDLVYARDGLTKGRTRMREDIERLQAENAALKREAHAWWTACADATKTQEELAMMVRMLTSSLKRHWPHAPQPGDLPSRAMDLLRRHNLMGSPLRDESNNRGPQQGA